MIVPVFVFGVSRTYRLFPLADNRLTRFLSRKVKEISGFSQQSMNSTVPSNLLP